MDEGAEGHASGAFGEPGLGVVVPGRAGNVQVNPRRVACEFANEPSAGDGAAAFAAADVLNVSEAALNEFAILVIHRQLPHFFADGFGAGEELLGPGLVGAEDADVDIGERDDDGTCKSGGVHKMGGAELLRVMNSIREDEPTFGVGVENFDGLAGHGGLNVAGLLRSAAGHVLGGRHHANDFDTGF